MTTLQYTRAEQPQRAESRFAERRATLRLAGPAAALLVLVAFGAFARHVSPREEGDWLNRLANGGDVGAQLELGLAYRAGRDGLPRDSRMALQWLERAAQGGDGYAADLVGDAYADGAGTSADPTRATHWWQVAAQAGNVDARRRLGGTAPGTVQEVEHVLTGETIRDQSGAALQVRAGQHDPVAEFQLAERYRDGAWAVNRPRTGAELAAPCRDGRQSDRASHAGRG